MKNKIARRSLCIFTVLVALTLILCLVGCQKEDSGEKKGITTIEDTTPSDSSVTFTVTFDSNGGSAVSPITAKVNEKISAPSEPTKTGYDFEGWYASADYFMGWNFASDIVTSNMTLYAKWVLSNDIYIADPAFGMSKGDYLYKVSVGTETLSLTNKIVLRNPDYVYTFYSDAACSQQVCEPDTAEFTLQHGDNVYYVRIMGERKEIVTVKFVVKRNSMFTMSYYGINEELLYTTEAEEGTVFVEPYAYAVQGHSVEWLTDSGSKWVFGTNGTALTANVNLHAYASIKTYTVELNVNGGNETYRPVRITYGTYYSLPVPTKSGSGFSGWYTSYGVQLTGSNGTSFTVWDIQENMTLTARWLENVVDIHHFVMLNDQYVTTTGDIVVDKADTVPYGKSYTFTAHSAFEQVKVDTYSYTVYVFFGWFNNNNGLLTKDRTYTDNSVSENTTVTEKWYSLTIVPDGSGVDQEISFSSETFDEYGYVTAGERIAVTADCVCKEHTFLSWSTGSTEKTLYIFTSNEEGLYTAFHDLSMGGDGYVVSTNWATLSVFFTMEVNGEEVANNGAYTFLYEALGGEGPARRGEDRTVHASSQSDYTFMGWYEGETLKSETGSFDYDFIMMDTVTLTAKWYKTDKLYEIVPESGSVGTVTILPDATANVVGGTVTLQVNGASGYVLDGLYPKTIVEGEDPVYGEREYVDAFELTRTLPSEPALYESRFVTNKLTVLSNTYNAGRITYDINYENRGRLATNYGGEVCFAEMLGTDSVTLRTETYDGYVWLGWYDEDKLLTSNTTIMVDDVMTERTIIACWKAISYDINVTAGVYTAATVSYINKPNVYYTYDFETATYLPVVTTGATSPDVKYFTFSNNTYTGGTQTAVARRSDSATGEDVTLTAKVNSGYRFEGWFDENFNRITVDRVYTFHIRNLGKNYKALYTRLPSDYEIQADVFEGTEAELAPVNAGKLSIYAYLEEQDDGYTEKCVIDVMTTKSEIDITADNAGNYTYVYKGYNYLGLYTITGDTPTWQSFQNGAERPENNYFNEDIFGYRYVYNMTEYRVANGNEIKHMMAAWKRGSSLNDYYVNMLVYSDNNNAGKLFYLVYNYNSLILLAEPNTGYLFDGWYKHEDDTDTLVSSDFVYAPGSDYARYVFMAKWREINTSGTAKEVRINSPTTREEGGYTAKALHPDGSNDLMQYKAYAETGYVFLGWYANDKLLTVDPELNILRKYSKVDNVTTEKLYLSDENGTPWGSLMDGSRIEPKWRKTNAAAIVESVGDVEIVGFYDADGEPWYRLKTYSPLDFNDKGNAWYQGYYFLGWYGWVDDEYVCVSREYEYHVKAGYLLTQYKAVWTTVDVVVSFNGNEEQLNPMYVGAGGTATYGFALDYEGRLYLTFYAIPNDGYTFLGWVPDNASEPDSFSLIRNISALGLVDNIDPDVLHINYAYKVTFQRISDEDKPTAKVAEVNDPLTAPEIIGYRDDSGNFWYRLTARDLDGYIFEGWQREGESAPYTTSRTITYEDGSVVSPPVAIYREITQSAYYPLFKVNVDKEYASSVHYYGYVENGHRVVEIKAAIPSGYLMQVTNSSSGEIIYGTSFEGTYDETTFSPTITGRNNVFAVKLTDAAVINGTINVRFLLVSEFNGGYTKTQQQVNYVTVERRGTFYDETPMVGDARNTLFVDELSGKISLNLDGRSFVVTFEKASETLLDMMFTFVGTTEEANNIYRQNVDSIFNEASDLLMDAIWDEIFEYGLRDVLAVENEVPYSIALNKDVSRERWTLSTEFDDMQGNAYTFIGWFDEDSVLLSTKERYEIDALVVDHSYTTQFGIYRLQLVNEVETAGTIYAMGYDVTVSFDLNLSGETLISALGTTVIPSQTVNLGQRITYPTQPVDVVTKEYMFGGWYDNPEGEGAPFDFRSEIKSDITLYAKWVYIVNTDGEYEQVVLLNGSANKYNTTQGEGRSFFTALADTTYKIALKNAYSSQVTQVCIYELRYIAVGLAYDTYENYIARYEVVDSKETVKYFPVEIGKTYMISITAKTGTNGNLFTYKLTGSVPDSTAMRANTVPYAGSFTVVAEPFDYDPVDYSANKFVGWYIDDVLVSEKATYSTSTLRTYSSYDTTFRLGQKDYGTYADDNFVITLTAKWVVFTVEVITTDRSGGRYSVELVNETPEGVLEVTGADQRAYEWNLTAAPYSTNGYEFGGWYRYDEESNTFDTIPLSPLFNPEGDEYKFLLTDSALDVRLILKCQWNYLDSSSKRTITYSMNMEGATNSRYNPSEYVPQTSGLITLYDAFKYYYEDGALAGYYSFEGWYSDSQFKNKMTTIDPKVWSTNITLYAKWGPLIKFVELQRDENGIRYFYLGEYPQAKFTDVEDIAYESATRLYYSRSTGLQYVGVENGEERVYYAIQPIRWDVIEGSGYLYVVSHSVLYATVFNITTNMMDTYCSNNWEQSGLRSYLNGSFLSSFGTIERNLINASIANDGITNNSSAQGNPAYSSQYWSTNNNDTSDVAFAMSYKELTDTDKGFMGDASSSDEMRVAEYSDYALYLSGGVNAGYWTRSVGNNDSSVYYVTSTGKLEIRKVNTLCGVRPTMQLLDTYLTLEK